MREKGLLQVNIPFLKGDVHLKEALCMDCIFCCGFNFVSGVNHSHFRFGMQQPRRLQCLIIVYQQAVGQDLYFHGEDPIELLNGIFTMLLFIKHCLHASKHPFNSSMVFAGMTSTLRLPPSKVFTFTSRSMAVPMAARKPEVPESPLLP